MYTLGIDTASNLLSIAIARNGKEVVAQCNELSNMQHGVRLVPRIDELFEENHVEVADIDKIIIGIGPGSYTGLRIGVTVAKMWGISKNIPVYPVSSLALMAAAIDPSQTDFIIPIMDARRLSAYTAIYQYQNEQLTAVIEDTHNDWESWLNGNQMIFETSTNIILVGDQIDAFVDKAREMYPSIEWQVIDGISAMPQIARAFTMPLTVFEDIHLLSPYYAQLTLAEREWLEKTENQNQNETLVDTTID